MITKHTSTTKKHVKFPSIHPIFFTEAMIVCTYCVIVLTYPMIVRYIRGPFSRIEDHLARFRVFSAIVFGAMAIGEASSFTPDASKAAASAEKIFALIDLEPSIDSERTDGLKLEQV